MSPVTHLFASWIIAAKTTDNARDCRLVALAGVAPDLDGLGLVVDLGARAFGYQTFFWDRFHHVLLHGAFGAILTASIFALCARRKLRVAFLSLITFHLHLLCDFLGSRGPSPGDLWPILYFTPFFREPAWIWTGQWSLDAWQNKLFSVLLLLWIFQIAITRGVSVVHIFHQKADATFVQVIRGWWTKLTQRKVANSS
jgi:hypothetical protein